MPKNQAKSTPKTQPGIKGEFIRKHPNKSVAEIIELGKQAGIPIKASFVYNVRSADKKATGKAVHKQPPGTRTAANGQSKRQTTSIRATFDVDAGVKSQLRNFVLRVGIDRAPQVFDQVLSDLKREVETAS